MAVTYLVQNIEAKQLRIKITLQRNETLVIIRISHATTIVLLLFFFPYYFFWERLVLLFHYDFLFKKKWIDTFKNAWNLFLDIKFCVRN